MKNLVLFLSLITTLSVYSQHIAKKSFACFLLNQNIEGAVWGYNTHFNQMSGANTITFISAQDTVVVQSNNWTLADDYMQFYSTKVFTNAGTYKVYISNAIDGQMEVPGYVIVKPQHNRIYIDPTVDRLKGYRVNYGKHYSKLIFNSSVLVHNANFSAFFINPELDTIQVDTLTYKRNTATPYDYFELSFDIPAQSKPGIYQLYIDGLTDTLLFCDQALFVENNLFVQIDSISPDSFSNIYPPNTNIELKVYGNKTHFTNDSNMVFDTYYFPNIIDSTVVLNDSVMSVYVKLPLPVKQAVSPNLYFQLYNPDDGLLVYPIRIDLFGSIDAAQAGFGKVDLFPNPATDYLILSSDEFVKSGKLLVTVYTINGKELFNKTYPAASRLKLDIKNLSKGVYFVQINDSKKQSVLKFVKQ